MLIALSLMSFVLVIVLSLILMASVETANAANAKDRLLARENARLGLMIALGDLQRYAGPDQRVTARAEILGDGSYQEAAKFWTGLWTSTSSGGISNNPVWLVSGDPSTTPASFTPTESIRMDAAPTDQPDATTDQPEVRVPIVEVLGPDGKNSEFAFWVVDEGVKASIAARRDSVSNYQKEALESQRRVAEYQVNFGVDLAPFFDGANLDLREESFANNLQQVIDYRDIALVRDSGGQPLVLPSGGLAELQHDLTSTAFGVLENPIDGGLKKNLSDTAFRDSFLATDDMQKFLAPKNGFLEVDVSSGLPSRRSFAGKPYYSPRPLLTEAVLYIGLFHTFSDGKVRIRFHMEAEFVNPYTLPLRFPTDSDSSYDRGAVLVFDNLPTITVEDLTVGTPAPVLVEDLNELSAYAPTDSRYGINSWFDIAPTSTPNVPILNPGEIYQVMEPNPVTQPRGLARDFGTIRWSDNAGTRPEDGARIRVSAVHPAEGVTLTLVPFQGSSDFASRPPLVKIEGVEYDDFELTKTFRGGPNPFSRPFSSDYEIVDYVFAYHFRIQSDDTDITSMRDILTSIDLRDPDIIGAEQFVDIEGNEKAIGSVFEVYEKDPSFAIGDDSNFFSDLDQIYDETVRTHAVNDRKSLLYDIPDSPVLSVGQLSSLHIYRRKPRSIGEPWGGEFNEAFDRYYFSPKQTDPTTTGAILLNPGIVSLVEPEQLPDQNDAALELTVGSFNINSTSVAAWEAVLASPVLTPESLDENARGTSDITRSAAFFRLPQYQARKSEIEDEKNDFFVTLEKLREPLLAPDRFFAQGIRSLHGNDGALQTRQIAENIVSELKERGTPFSDLNSFVNSGILQEAIDDVGTGSGLADAVNESLMEYSNVFLTQGDILTKIAPQATTRSDTFKIRVYGATNDAITGGGKNAVWCEATVQRLPTKIDGSDALTPATASSPRKFKIISIRWLSDETS